ncbi:Dihydroxyacetone kinase [Lecanosticta acicola]|uniref:Dihydroxyacetone kinase n=1 Tax=Lecanosticta acicola TaxID=111012 RepID=A0AAI8Z6K7_9PEZI|nr:Dihydroxyacetone kinase [Lecanosticta acicola]
MAVVVEPTIPFTPSTLDLENPTRWTTLFPLIRPTVQSVQTPKGHTLLVDTSKSQGKQYLHIVAAATLGHFSSQLLDERHVTAIVVAETTGAGIPVTAGDLPQTLRRAGVEMGPGVVLVRAGRAAESKAVVVQHTPDVLEVVCEGALAADHALQLIGTAKGGVRANPHTMAEMLKGFVRRVKITEGWFGTEKVDGRAAVAMHSDEGSEGFRGAKEVVRKVLERAMREVDVDGEGKREEEDVVYSVHFSDVNGLSRLENYIIAGEIAEVFDSQNLPYTLSHSTIHNHTQPARGFAISLCPIPQHFLAPSPKPTPHHPSSTTTTIHPPSPSHPQIELPLSDAHLRSLITTGCQALITAEPTITHYDTIAGDADCGTTLRSGATTVLACLSTYPSHLQKTLPHFLKALVQELEISMGGTSGALYCIFLTALANSLGNATWSNSSEGFAAAALKTALEELYKYTPAREGDRTMMDALIPFIHSFPEEGGEGALRKAWEGVGRTEGLSATLGRSSYLSERVTRGVPDPGAYGLGVLLGGLVGGKGGGEGEGEVRSR